MIWALTLKPGQECTHEGLEEIHLSLASLECRPGKCQAGTDGSDLISYLLLKSGHTEQVLCTLEKGHSTQQNLDLVLQPRERVTFSVEGSGIVYVTGYSTSLPVDESEEEEEGIMGRIEYEELNPLHTVVKQEPEDDTCWELRYDESEDGLLNSATICGVPESPHFLEEEEQMPHDEEEEFEQLNQPCEPLEIAGDQHSKIFEQDTVLIKVDPEEAPAEDEDTRNVEIQGEISGGNIHESDTAGVFSGGIASCTRNAAHTTQAAGDINDVPMKVTVTQQNENVTENDHLQTGIASRTRNAVHTTQSAGDTSDVPMKVTETKLNKSNTENDHTPCDNSNMARNGEGSVIESTTSRKNELGAQASGRHPRPTITRVLPTRRVIPSRTRNAFRRSLAEDPDEDLMQTSDLHQIVETEANDKTTNGCSDDTNDQVENVQRRRLRSTVKRDLPPTRDCSHVTNDQEGSARDMIDHKTVTLHRSKVRRRHLRSKVKNDLPFRRDRRSTLTLSSVGRSYTIGSLKKTCVKNPDDVLVCRTCGKRFSSKYHRMKHEKLHVPKNTYKCRFCDQEFLITTERNAHESVHIKDKCYRCQFCGKDCKTKFCLGEHENIHTGHRP
ncbi:hypothetical protein HOLleu_41538 [Holothuria leucospilota]|uniref:C2H2-type domain-containing protein n=1 Tax=Holothuria leucospilota TaxID=206669 RepID=A0A9Q0YG08_HOLLE|nr:hypothetical protein HOLleu_41538 [Holothuria leucospilota]